MLFQPSRSSSSGSSSDGAVITALTSRVALLEGIRVNAVWFEVIGAGTSGTITPPSNGAIVLDRFPDGADCLVSTLDGSGLPDWSTPKTAADELVTAELDALGNWTLHGVPAQYPVALLYCYRSNLVSRDPAKELFDADFDSGSTGSAPVTLADVVGLVAALAGKAAITHASLHATGAEDAISASSIGAAATAHTHAQSDVTSLEASLSGKEPAFTKNTAFNKNFGTAAGTVCQGNDSRLSDARTPVAHTHTVSSITDLSSAISSKCRELLSAPIVSTSTTPSAEAFRTTLTLAARDVVRIIAFTTSTYTTATTNRRFQVGYRTAAGVFASLGQYTVASAAAAAVRPGTLQCVSVNGDGTSNYIYWGVDGQTSAISFTAPSALIFQWNLWVDAGGDTSTLNSLLVTFFSRG